jgi:hypothetical protein
MKIGDIITVSGTVTGTGNVKAVVVEIDGDYITARNIEDGTKYYFQKRFIV